MHLYLHIPFCRQACHYCDFHFSTQLASKQTLISALCKEITLQKDYLGSPILETIYIGGGTPSLLNEAELNQVFETIHRHFVVLPTAEITLEANPDDISETLLRAWQKLGINRLSIGVQSFHEPHLRFMNRLHTAHEAENSIKKAQDLGFESMSIDLIYGIPAPNHAVWYNDLVKAISLNIPHISSYCLTIEPKTAFGVWLKKAKLHP